MVSTQHSEKVTLPALREDIMEKVVKAVIPGKGFFQMFVYIFLCIFLYLYIIYTIFLQLSAVISLGRFRFQALPDLWSPRVWFTIRNKKV